MPINPSHNGYISKLKNGFGMRGNRFQSASRKELPKRVEGLEINSFG
jgi:hypothetical protein